MSYYSRLMGAMLYAHSRNVNVEVFPNVVKYSIPLYKDGSTTRILRANIEFDTLTIYTKRNQGMNDSKCFITPTEKALPIHLYRAETEIPLV